MELPAECVRTPLDHNSEYLLFQLSFTGYLSVMIRQTHQNRATWAERDEKSELVNPARTPDQVQWIHKMLTIPFELNAENQWRPFYSVHLAGLHLLQQIKKIIFVNFCCSMLQEVSRRIK
jgi:hypothetical protein